jgi:hypothetical protein
MPAGLRPRFDSKGKSTIDLARVSNPRSFAAFPLDSSPFFILDNFHS